MQTLVSDGVNQVIIGENNILSVRKLKPHHHWTFQQDGPKPQSPPRLGFRTNPGRVLSCRQSPDLKAVTACKLKNISEP